MKGDRPALILEAALTLLARHGIAGLSMRAVAREAGVALGLVSYYYADKTSLVGAALTRIGEQDLAIVDPDPGPDPVGRLRAALHRVADPSFLTTAYLSLRLQLWSLAQAHPDYEKINTDAQSRYRDGLAALIAAARPELDDAERARRAADIDVLQNGLWLTALLGLDDASISRCVRRTEQIALSPGGGRPS